MISIARIRAHQSAAIKHQEAILHRKQMKGEARLQSIYSTLHHPKNGRLPLDVLKREIASIFEISVSDLVGKARRRPLVWARAVLGRILHDRNLSYPTIGRVLGGRDHSTVINWIRNFDIYERLDPRVTEAYLMLRDREPMDG